MAALENKIDFAIAFEVNNANPNGDPLNGNRPRTTSEGLGEVLLTTYEMIPGASGQTPHSAEKDGDADAAKRALIPYGHTTLPVSLTVLVDANGCIRGVAKRKSTIIIPCTEESMGRTIKPVPHPLFDQLQYVDSGRSPEKTSMYLQQLAKWKGDDAKLEAVFKCVSEHSISEAAAHYGVELTDKDDKAGVCFEVQIGLEDSDLSNDVDIRNRWIAYLQRSQHRLGKDVFGEDLYTPTTNFPKKVVSSDANAKLLSANDSTNFTIRMTKPWRKCHYGQLKESCVSRIRVLRLLLWGAAANWAFLWHSIHREVIITVPC